MFTTTRRMVGTLGAALALAALTSAPVSAAPGPTLSSAAQRAASVGQIKPIYTINFRPVFNDYLYCLKDYGNPTKAWVYADFTDANDNDANLDVTLESFYDGVQHMDVSDGYHGVFFYEKATLPYAHALLTLKATDPHGAVSDTWKAWLYADGSCGAAWHD